MERICSLDSPGRGRRGGANRLSYGPAEMALPAADAPAIFVSVPAQCLGRSPPEPPLCSLHIVAHVLRYRIWGMEGQDYCVSIPLDGHLVDVLCQTGQRLASMGGWEPAGSAAEVALARRSVVPHMVFAIPPLLHLLRDGELLPGTDAAAQVSDLIAQWSAAAVAYSWLLDPEAVQRAATEMRSEHPDLGVALGGGCPTITQLNAFIRRMTSRMVEHTRTVSDQLMGVKSSITYDLALAITTCVLANLSAVGHLGSEALSLVQRWGTPVRVENRFGPRPNLTTARFAPHWPSPN